MNSFNVVVEEGEDGYLISEVIELPGCHTQAKDLNELMKRTKEAILLYLQEQTSVTKNVFRGIQKIEV